MRVNALPLFTYLLVGSVLCTIPCHAQAPRAAQTLTELLAAKRAQSKAPPATRAIMSKAIRSLEESGITTRIPKVGDVLPDGTFRNARGERTQLYDVIGKKRAVITFYRGGWCPYCNLQLRYYQQHLEEFEELNASLVAISPEQPDESLSTKEKSELAFPVLSDNDNSYGKEIGIVYSLPSALIEVYKEFGINLTKSNQSEAWELPLSATFVVTPDREVLYVFAEADYTKRAPLNELLEALKK